VLYEKKSPLTDFFCNFYKHQSLLFIKDIVTREEVRFCFSERSVDGENEKQENNCIWTSSWKV